MMMNIVSRFIKMLATFPLMQICHVAQNGLILGHTDLRAQAMLRETHFP
jgi:hypothetical protein